LAGDDALRTVGADLSTSDGPARLVGVAIATFGRLDILVKNVGAVKPRTGGFLPVTDEDWTIALNLNLLAAFRTARAGPPHLLDAGSAGIVTIASFNATLPDPLVIDYSAAESALLNFSKSLSKDVGHRRARVNTISPRPVSTGLWLGTDGKAAAIAKEHGSEPDAA
jgi:NAD(P)-dependent dehydrogenase (short-subunit alcohol dehydrogenase family)